MTIYLLNMFHRNCLLRTIKIAFHFKILRVRLPHSPLTVTFDTRIFCLLLKISQVFILKRMDSLAQASTPKTRSLGKFCTSNLQQLTFYCVLSKKQIISTVHY